MSDETRKPTLEADSVAPILCARNVKVALERYEKLGFVCTAYEKGDDPVYGFVCYGPGDFHVVRVPDLNPDQNCAGMYLYVHDADAVYEAWTSAGVGGDFTEPYDTEYRLREMVWVDPDGNLFRVGSTIG